MTISHTKSWAASPLMHRCLVKDTLRRDDMNRVEGRNEDSDNYDCNPCVVYISLPHPRKVVMASQEWLDLMGTERDLCIGQPLQFSGPETDKEALEGLFKCDQSSGRVRLFIYPMNTSHPILCCVRAQEMTRKTGTQKSCRLTMTKCCDAWPYKSVLLDDVNSMLVVKAVEPYNIVHASSGFEKHYGYSHGAGRRSCQFLHGPKTDLMIWKRVILQGLESERGSKSSSVQLVLYDVFETPVLSRLESQLCVGETTATSVMLLLMVSPLDHDDSHKSTV